MTVRIGKIQRFRFEKLLLIPLAVLVGFALSLFALTFAAAAQYVLFFGIPAIGLNAIFWEARRRHRENRYHTDYRRMYVENYQEQ